MWSAYSDDTISGHSVSTGWSTSMPNCCAASPQPHTIGSTSHRQEEPANPGGQPLDHSGAAGCDRAILAWPTTSMAPEDHPTHDTEIIVIPRSMELEAAELDLAFALVAVVTGTRPYVSLDMVRDHLAAYFDIGPATVSVRRHDLKISSSGSPDWRTVTRRCARPSRRRRSRSGGTHGGGPRLLLWGLSIFASLWACDAYRCTQGAWRMLC